MAKVGKYELVRKLATGGMAEVFLARFEWARGLEKTVVVKRILYHLAEDPSFIEMFFTEAQLAAQLSHPNIAQIIEFGESEGVYFLAMEYIDGMSLRALAAAAHASGAGIPFAHCARIAAFCCEALTHAHELTDSATEQPLNLVHRDVSPDNILVAKTGSVKLVDFGIAKAATQNHQTKTGLVKGKLSYMAPEQIRAEPLDRRADVFALGVVLYELVAGKKPYEAPSEITLIHAVLYEERVPLRTRRPDVPPELERIVGKALERDRDKRYPDCRAMHADLEDYLISVRQPVSALQIAQLVEKYRGVPGKPEGTPAPAMATPNRVIAPARTPEPFRAERTPADSATAQLRKPLQQTGTDGDRGGAAATEREMPAVVPPPPVERTELIAASKPKEPPPASKAEPPAPRAEGARKAEVKSRRPAILVAAAALVLLGGTLALLRPSRAVSPQQTEQVQSPVPGEDQKTEEIAAGPTAIPQPEPSLASPPAAPPEPVPSPTTQPVAAKPETQPALAPRPLAVKQEPSPTPAPPSPKPRPAPMIELVVSSEPAGAVKAFVGGKMRASHQSPLTARLPPGTVELEVSGTSSQSFRKRETIVLEVADKRREHKIVVGKGAVLVRAFPAAHVTVDGVLRADTPAKLTLYEGEHSVRFECDRSIPKCADAAPVTKPVTVQAGRTSELIQRWP